MRSLHSITERSSIAERDWVWPLGESVTVLIALQVAFWLGVGVTMFVYQIGWLEPVR